MVAFTLPMLKSILPRTMTYTYRDTSNGPKIEKINSTLRVVTWYELKKGHGTRDSNKTGMHPVPTLSLSTPNNNNNKLLHLHDNLVIVMVRQSGMPIVGHQ